MNVGLNPNQAGSRRGDFQLPGNINLTGLENFLVKIGNNGGAPNFYLPATVDDVALYIVMAGDIAGNPTFVETPDTGESCMLAARGTGGAGDILILADVPVQGVISGTSNANPDVITTSAAHGLQVGDNITITGVVGDTAVNIAGYVLTVPSTTTLTISATPGGAAIAGNGAYVSGGIYYANVGDAGKVRSLTGSLAPTKPGRYFRAAVAEVNFGDGDFVKARWFPGEVRIVSSLNSLVDDSTGTAPAAVAGVVTIAAVTSYATAANAIAALIAEVNALRADLETQGVLA